ncbi:MAG: replication-associated recombination protein A [Clostridia bacterium]|nr:replication-associated recombination protein A [Clostridia bacterium]
MNNKPIADILRPTSFSQVAGQAHLVSARGVITRMLGSGRISNMIFFGPPGTGKTTVANIIAKNSQMELFKLNATTASLSDIKEVIASSDSVFSSKGILLYLDEIQYFNRKQQQSLLEFIEDGRVTLIASTTENPYFCIYDALISRCSVFEFKHVSAKEIVPVLKRALEELNRENSLAKIANDDALEFLAGCAGGDVRHALTLFEGAYFASDNEITEEIAREFIPSISAGMFDRDSDVHHNLLSGLQKSIRGSDPDAAVFYLARLLEGGDIISACRRLQVIASEDIGLAYPQAAQITYALCQSAKELGLPEARIPLANCAIMLATAPKSNTAYLAIAKASEDIKAGKGTETPIHLQAPLFKGYKYPHDFPNDYVEQQYLPDDIKNAKYYEYGSNKTEQAAKSYWEAIKGKKL